jgi:Ca2+-binding RTX toxin-like protein
MLGGSGNDTYVVNATGDRVFETTTSSSTTNAGGIDTVQSAVSFNLDANAGVRFVEQLTLTGTAAINGTGNALANTLTGNSGNNILNGGAGNDTMLGGSGNDTYVVNVTGDRVFETTTSSSTTDAGGIDTVQSLVSFNLDANAGVRFVERLTLTGTAAVNGTGNALNNTLTGNSGNNILNGGIGSDALTGGSGADTFVFNTALGTSNVDRITDFNSDADTIRLENAVFAGLEAGTLAAPAFLSNTSGFAADASDRIIYESDTGRLYFDSDGTGVAERVHFATLTTGLTLTSADFFVF